LLPVTAILADENNVVARYLFDRYPKNPVYLASHWVLFAKSETVFSGENFTDTQTFTDDDQRVKWTDNYSAILPVIKLW
jgi:hypothetical protein